MNLLMDSTMDGATSGLIVTLIFCVFLWVFIMMFWKAACGIGLVKDFPKPKAKRPKVKIAVEPELEQDPNWFGTWNDKPQFSDFDPNPESELKPMSEPEPEPEPEPKPEPKPQTDPKLLEEGISGLHNWGVKKKDARAAVLRACEGRVFEDHQSLIEAALDKSNV